MLLCSVFAALVEFLNRESWKLGFALGSCSTVPWALISMLRGGNFLDYNVLAHDNLHGQHWGILLVELGIGITVTAVMITLFFLFAGRGLRGPSLLSHDD